MSAVLSTCEQSIKRERAAGEWLHSLDHWSIGALRANKNLYGHFCKWPSGEQAQALETVMNSQAKLCEWINDELFLLSRAEGESFLAHYGASNYEAIGKFFAAKIRNAYSQRMADLVDAL